MRTTVSRVLLTAALALACAPRRAVTSDRTELGTPALARPRALPRTQPSEFDPVGLLLELKGELGLTAEQVGELRSLRAALREANRSVLAQLDSADAAMRGRLRGWLGRARGEELPVRRTRWTPKVGPPQYATLVALLEHARGNARSTLEAAAALLDDEQRATLEQLARRDARLAVLTRFQVDARDARQAQRVP
ncbi:Spy/CpxP family protein refolding chaperone [Roseisolibacter agri]|uniref:Spy/CpxP family protein refolding chaperone n=1 Tax=Roseisolibacter agri TaxID=2014610 RepID=UPI0024E193A8|nr:Spy/CpxP family protein refolding chaperone [Roseisolibacter agri]